MNIRRYSMALKKEGFRLVYDSKAGGCRCVEFCKVVGDRQLEVQLWDDGQHRVTHFLNGVMNTEPTRFDGLTEMEKAIRKELTRKDHPPLSEYTKNHLLQQLANNLRALKMEPPSVSD